MNITLLGVMSRRFSDCLSNGQVSSLGFSRKSKARYRLEQERNIFSIIYIKALSVTKMNVGDTSFNMIACPRGAFIRVRPKLTSLLLKDGTVGTVVREIVPIKSFLLCDSEVTQRLYKEVMGSLPYGNIDEKDHPVENVFLYEAIDFCNKLSLLHNLTPYYEISTEMKYYADCDETNKITTISVNKKSNGYRLPSQEEWQYAGKAHTDNNWAGCNVEEDIHPFVWYDENSNYKTHPIKTKYPNEWGFYDMSGNVWEWCFSEEDNNNKKYFVKGGSWGSFASSTKLSNYLLAYDDYEQDRYLDSVSETGIRIARSIIV